MRADDVPIVADIEIEHVSPWTAEQIGGEQQKSAAICLVAENKEQEVIGWCCGRLVAPEAELLKIAVSKGWQRKGIASLLLFQFAAICTERGAKKSFLEVRSANMPARKLYKQHGWHREGIRKQYYTNPRDDAILLSCSLGK